MAVVKDPEGNEISTLRAMVDFNDLKVLEVGCGDGRLTWKYARDAAHVTGIDPAGEDIQKALANSPENLKGRVELLETSIEDFVVRQSERRFDLALFSWSL